MKTTSTGVNIRFSCALWDEDRGFSSGGIYFRSLLTSRRTHVSFSMQERKLFITHSISRLWSLSAQWEEYSPLDWCSAPPEQKTHSQCVMVPQRWARSMGTGWKTGTSRRTANTFWFNKKKKIQSLPPPLQSEPEALGMENLSSDQVRRLEDAKMGQGN